jgi:hypothetical protein
LIELTFIIRIWGLGVRVWGVERTKYQIPKPKFQGLLSEIFGNMRHKNVENSPVLVFSCTGKYLVKTTEGWRTPGYTKDLGFGG